MTEQEWHQCDDPLRMIDWLTGQICLKPQSGGGVSARHMIVSKRKKEMIEQAWKSDLCGRERKLLANILIPREFQEHRGILRNMGSEHHATAADLLREIIGSPFSPIVIKPEWRTDTVLSLAKGAEESMINTVPCKSCSGEGCSGNVGYLDDPYMRCDGSGRRRINYFVFDLTRLAVLSDSLEEAGCTNVDLLKHLRSPSPHVPGCWVIDALLYGDVV